MPNQSESLTINPKKTALLILHWQNELVKPNGKLYGPISKAIQANQIIENTAVALEASRQSGMMVVYVNVNHRPGYPEVPARQAPLADGLRKSGAFIKDSWGTQVIDELAPRENEFVIPNYSTSAFIASELDTLLRVQGITDVVLTGLATNWVVESTARDAFNRGYFVYTLSDCCYGTSEEAHNYSVTNVLPMIGLVLRAAEYREKLKIEI